MTVETKKVDGRREIHYADFDALMSDAESLAAGEFQTLGNWTFPQILEHITLALNCTVDGFGFRAPLPLRLMSRVFFKNKFLTQTLPAGFSIPKQLPQPDDIAMDQALANMKSAIEKLRSSSAERAEHPFVGKLSREDSDALQLRHAELHMSFVVPNEP